jgi:hypothetical protein
MKRFAAMLALAALGVFAPSALATTELYLSTAGTDTGTCPKSAPCLTMKYAYTHSANKETTIVNMKGGTYGLQEVRGKNEKEAGTTVVFRAETGTGAVNFSGTVYLGDGHITIEKLGGGKLQDLVVGDYDETPEEPDPENVLVIGVEGRSFNVSGGKNVRITESTWGPSSSCGGPYGGFNNSIREIVPGQPPEKVFITHDTIHGVQSYNLTNCHTEGLAVFAGKEVEIENDVFYENSVFDVFVQQSEVGVKKEPATLEGLNLKKDSMADPQDMSGANGEAVGAHNGRPFGTTYGKHIHLIDDHLNGVLQLEEAPITKFEDVLVEGTFGKVPYAYFECTLWTEKGVVFKHNVWANNFVKCAEDVSLSKEEKAGTLPYVEGSDNSSLNYSLTKPWSEEYSF